MARREVETPGQPLDAFVTHELVEHAPAGQLRPRDAAERGLGVFPDEVQHRAVAGAAAALDESSEVAIRQGCKWYVDRFPGIKEAQDASSGNRVRPILRA